MLRYLLEAMKVFFLGALAAVLSAFLVAVPGSLIFNPWIDLHVFPVATFFFVAVGGLSSSLDKKYTALGLAGTSLLFAAFYVGESVRPETYEPTYIPLWFISLAALLAFLLVYVRAEKRSSLLPLATQDGDGHRGS